MVGAEEQAGEETSLSFRIHSPFYQTVWFYSLIVIGILSLLYTLHRYRMRHVLKVERLRLRIASDLHDDIGSTLSSISLLSEMASQYDKESVLAKALSKIGTDSRSVLNAMDDIIWSVNPQNDSLSSLAVRLREYAIPMCESKNILFHLNVDEAIYSLRLGMEERRNIFLIVKEAINNAVKHSGCQNLWVVFTKKVELEMEVRDDGCGFDPASPTSRNGIVNIKHRASKIGGTLQLHSVKGAGTRVTLRAKAM
jgi:signal transduction histidine kinase